MLNGFKGLFSLCAALYVLYANILSFVCFITFTSLSLGQKLRAERNCSTFTYIVKLVYKNLVNITFGTKILLKLVSLPISGRYSIHVMSEKIIMRKIKSL